MIVGTAGHIDHGKTRLVRALTGVDTDRLKEEKARGISIDLGFAYREVEPGVMLGFVDVPGHEGFIHNMLAGVTGIQFALLVVAADDGVMPQTREHFAILDLLGLNRGAVAITKVDAVSQGRRHEVAESARDLLAGSTLDSSPLFPVSSVTGEGIEALKAHLEEAARRTGAPAPRGHFRLAVDRCFSLAGHGTIVTGTALSGEVHPGDPVIVSPAGLEARVRGLHAAHRSRHGGREGERLAINLAGPRVEKSAIRRGDWIVAAPVHAPTERLDVKLRVLESEERPVRAGTPVHFHIGCHDGLARIHPLEGAVEPGHASIVQLVVEGRVVAARGDRFVVRDASARRTVGGGVVLDPAGPARRRAVPERLAQLHALEAPDPIESARRLLGIAPFRIERNAFEVACNLRPEEAEPMWTALGTVETTEGGRRYVLRRSEGGAPSASQPRPAPMQGTELEPAIRARLEAAFATDPKKPRSLTELSATTALDTRVLESALRSMARQRTIYQISPGHYLGRAALLANAQAFAELASAGGVSLSAFRDKTGYPRRAAVGILEFFDRAGFTQRRGELRFVAKPVEKSFG